MGSKKWYCEFQKGLLQAQLETLKKDLEDKEDLLVQTANAYELLKEIYKQNIEMLVHVHDEEKEELQNQIQKLKNVSIIKTRRDVY